MIRRHFAVLGSTGVGKATSVSLLLRKSVAMRPNLRVIIFDPHNEYAAHFPGLAQVIDSDSLELPFWMFRFDELADVVFSGRQPHADERDALYEVIRAANAKYLAELGAPGCDQYGAAPANLRRGFRHRRYADALPDHRRRRHHQGVAWNARSALRPF
jgi:Helicase HerA, central domain